MTTKSICIYKQQESKQDMLVVYLCFCVLVNSLEFCVFVHFLPGWVPVGVFLLLKTFIENMQISLLYIMLNDLLCYLYILVYILNIHESKSAQVGQLHRPSWYAAFYTILNASARHVTSPLVTLAKGQLFGSYLVSLAGKELMTISWPKYEQDTYMTKLSRSYLP